MSRKNELRFCIYARDLARVCEWLDDEFYSYSFTRKNETLILMIIDIRDDPGKAGRAFDVGYAVSRIERKKVVNG